MVETELEIDLIKLNLTMFRRNQIKTKKFKTSS